MAGLVLYPVTTVPSASQMLVTMVPDKDGLGTSFMKTLLNYNVVKILPLFLPTATVIQLAVACRNRMQSIYGLHSRLACAFGATCRMHRNLLAATCNAQLGALDHMLPRAVDTALEEDVSQVQMVQQLAAQEMERGALFMMEVKSMCDEIR